MWNYTCIRWLINWSDFIWNICHSAKHWARYDQISTQLSVYSTRYSCHSLMKLEFSGQIFEKYSNNKCHENSYSGSRVVPCGQTCRRTGRQEGRQTERIYYVLLTVHPGRTLGKWPTWSTIILYNTFIIIMLYMFRATLCSSPGGQIV